MQIQHTAHYDSPVLTAVGGAVELLHLISRARLAAGQEPALLSVEEEDRCRRAAQWSRYQTKLPGAAAVVTVGDVDHAVAAGDDPAVAGVGVRHRRLMGGDRDGRGAPVPAGVGRADDLPGAGTLLARAIAERHPAFVVRGKAKVGR